MTDFSATETSHVIKLAHTLKKQRRARLAKPTHQGMVLGLFFEKQSLRTRVSFESAMAHLGGSSIFLTNADVGLGKRESVRDFAQIISRYVDILAVRTFEHKLVDELCQHATCPVINALSDEAHPCQALADIMTVQELWGKKPGKPKLAFVGDGNNVARDLAIACRQTGVDFVLAAPKGYSFDAEFISSAQAMAGTGTIELVTSPADAVRSADFVYTDVWVSMGQEDEKKTRLKAFAQYKIDSKLMKLAKSDCYFLHCLPAHRDEEVSAEVIDGPMSRVVDQAENRLHVQKALIVWLLELAAHQLNGKPVDRTSSMAVDGKRNKSAKLAAKQ